MSSSSVSIFIWLGFLQCATTLGFYGLPLTITMLRNHHTKWFLVDHKLCLLVVLADHEPCMMGKLIYTTHTHLSFILKHFLLLLCTCITLINARTFASSFCTCKQLIIDVHIKRDPSTEIHGYHPLVLASSLGILFTYMVHQYIRLL
jgi:hypothetical protein